MEHESGKDPEALPDEALDEAAGGLSFNGQTQPSDVSITDGTSNITDGTSKAATGFLGGVFVAGGDVNNDAIARKIADGSVKGV